MKPAKTNHYGGLTWRLVSDVGFDAQGNLLMLGIGALANGEAVQAWSLSPSGELRWAYTGELELGESNGERARLAGFFEGVAFLWAPDSHKVIKLSAETGELLGTLGGREPKDAKEHHLDACRFESLTVDTDGTLVGEVGNRLLRWSPEGEPMRTWPRQPLLWDIAGFGLISRQRFQSLYEDNSTSDGFAVDENCRARELKDTSGYFDGIVGLAARPKFVGAGEARIGWDGKLYVFDSSRNYRVLLRYDRAGNLDYRVALPENFNTNQMLLTADSTGQVYLICQDEKECRQVVRMSADGAEFKVLLQDDELRHAVVSVGADGSLAVASGSSELYIIDGEGKPVFKGGEAKPASGPPEGKAATPRKTFPLPAARPMRFALMALLIVLGLGRIAYLEKSVTPRVQSVITTNTAYVLRSSKFKWTLTPKRADELIAILPGEVIREIIITLLLVWCTLLSIRYPRDSLLVTAFVLIVPNLIGIALHGLNITPLKNLHLNFNIALLLYIPTFFALFVWGLALTSLPKQNKWPRDA